MENQNTNISLIVRTIVLILALINQILTLFNMPILPFEEEEITNALTTVITLVAVAWSYWKNNSFSKEAKEADYIMQDSMIKRLNRW